MSALAGHLRVTRRMPPEQGGGYRYRCEVIVDGAVVAVLPHVTGYSLDDARASEGDLARGTVHTLGLEVHYDPAHAHTGGRG